MKKVIILLMVALSVWAAPYKVGQSVMPLDLNDQFGKRLTLKAMPKTLIMAFEKGTGATVNEYLTVQEKGYLVKNKAAFVADISQMPKFITESFALPKMRKYTHTVLLIQDEEQGLNFPYQEDKITVMKFRGNFLTKVEFIETTAELKKAIEQ
ncbi:MULTISPECIES: hypothetical protein [unclassified Sulfuricurvum]|uniref:hypothetical protein n=1 Tax=unclassified Sulfuricurvum TaxID=2632390 RepID=UPI0002997F56|nr:MULTISPECIES: hypothetical protein [unclassified Sulfuricurvum]OHD83382.1 MAG: hypothetical protein A3J39_04190 [Sulfuricurvum sp. RIFCSPHIGHO2_12_FULL_44_8]OHD84031.1 MAG: hypothetical protein A3D90_00740 [Sulfuricurvum sp. RIFCSPHIGHO2_02_FULL_43_9]OHD86067.1 MAG: hypothetical protein A3I60_03405 [Sulfuricurvum sp. RIFCSPLOWO2_02_FULL_43_45]OHD89889.1 MAG: hypothetical protein A2W83_06390 [Sulfuricurvum sp. RIFCSPLOWO2_12_43_5]AFV98575.1 hypothetical protein B649_11320 [Candidatus Sulfuri